jgi:hypothetical protein
MSDETTNDNAARLDELTKGNTARIEALAVKGIAVDQNSLDRARLAWLCNTLLPEGSPERVTFELGLQELYAGQLDEIESQVRRQILTQGVHMNGASRRPTS